MGAGVSGSAIACTAGVVSFVGFSFLGKGETIFLRLRATVAHCLRHRGREVRVAKGGGIFGLLKLKEYFVPRETQMEGK